MAVAPSEDVLSRSLLFPCVLLGALGLAVPAQAQTEERSKAVSELSLVLNAKDDLQLDPPSLELPATVAGVVRCLALYGSPCIWMLADELDMPADIALEPRTRVERAPSPWRLGEVRQYIGHGGLALLALLREAENDITDEVAIAARPRGFGGFLSLHAELR
jgi:hypothetical protein